MYLHDIILSSLFLGLATSSALPRNIAISSAQAKSKGLDWAPCSSELLEATRADRNAMMDCAVLEVPLDYSSKRSKTINLQLLRVKATKKPFKGSVLLNPGGPGGSGVEFLARSPTVRDLLGGHFDVIGFDPRGTGRTIPFSCRDSTTSNSNIFSREDSKSLPQLDVWKTITNKAWNQQAFYADACFEKQKAYGRYIGTPFVARDMLSIVNALGEGDKLNYLGISYGSALGQVFASMFPDRIGRMLLDSNLIVDDYVTTLSSRTSQDTEKCLVHLFDQCIQAGPKVCRLANYSGPNTTSQDLTTALAELFEELISIATILPGSGSSLTAYPNVGISILIRLKSRIANSLSGPTDYPAAVEMIYYALKRNWEKSFNAMVPEKPSRWNRGEDAYNGVLCLDTSFRPKSLTDLRPMIQTHLAQGSFADIGLSRLLHCSQWRFKAPERIDLSKLENVTTSFPILFTNGVYDPVTPASSAFEASSRFRDSRVLLHEGVGHGIVAHPSNCTRDAVREYFEDGTLPEIGTICKQPVSAFNYLKLLESSDKV